VSRARIIVLELWLPALIVVAWWLWSSSAGSTFYPPLGDILDRFRQLWLFDRVAGDVWPTLRNMLLGYGIAAVAGVALGTAIARVRLLREATRPLVYFANSVPPIALIPIAIVLLGFGPSTRVIVIAFSALFPTLLATVDGVRALDPMLEDVTRVTRLRWRQRFFDVILPSAGPQIFAGLRVSLQVAFIVMISSEMLGSTEGIGFLTIQAQQSFAITDMWAGMLLLGVLGCLFNFLFLVVERRVLRWHHGMRAVAKAG
jgi:sulfonate transport system permease protein